MPSTQNQAVSALLFLYRRALGKDVGLIEDVERAKAPKRLPVVLSRGEVSAILARMSGVRRLVCWLLYGAGLRLAEGLGLRVKDIDFARNELTIRDGKGAKDRVSALPASCREPLREHLKKVRRLHEEDLARGLGRAPLPFALADKYPRVDREWAWQYVFPASSHYTDRQTVSNTATICTRRSCSGRWPKRCGSPNSPSQPLRTPCDIRSPRIYSIQGTTSEPFRSCLATTTSRRP